MLCVCVIETLMTSLRHLVQLHRVCVCVCVFNVLSHIVVGGTGAIVLTKVGGVVTITGVGLMDTKTSDTPVDLIAMVTPAIELGKTSGVEL